MGQKVYTSPPLFSGEESMVLNLETNTAGCYLLRISDGKKAEACRIVKKKVVISDRSHRFTDQLRDPPNSIQNS